MSRIDLAQTIHNAMPTPPFDVALSLPHDRPEPLDASEAPRPDPSPALIPPASNRRRANPLYRCADYLRRFLQAPTLQQIQSLNGTIQSMTMDIQALKNAIQDLTETTTVHAYKIDALKLEIRQNS